MIHWHLTHLSPGGAVIIFLAPPDRYLANIVAARLSKERGWHAPYSLKPMRE